MKCFENNGDGELCWTSISEGTELGQREKVIKRGSTDRRGERGKGWQIRREYIMWGKCRQTNKHADG